MYILLVLAFLLPDELPPMLVGTYPSLEACAIKAKSLRHEHAELLASPEAKEAGLQLACFKLVTEV